MTVKTDFNIKNDYFNWMCKKLGKKAVCYKRLLSFLYSIEFEYTHPMDGNRYEDGIDLRYRFGREFNIPTSQITSELDTCGCSWLEMMCALALRCEESIMTNTEEGDRTGKWFWEMISSSHMDGFMDKSHYTQRELEDYVMDRLHDIVEHNFAKNGDGGLFTIKNPDRDMRRSDIWYQAMWYLAEERR